MFAQPTLIVAVAPGYPGELRSWQHSPLGVDGAVSGNAAKLVFIDFSFPKAFSLDRGRVFTLLRDKW